MMFITFKNRIQESLIHFIIEQKAPMPRAYSNRKRRQIRQVVLIVHNHIELDVCQNDVYIILHLFCKWYCILQIIIKHISPMFLNEFRLTSNLHIDAKI